MMKLVFLLCLIASLPVWAMPAWKDYEFSGNVEAQGRHSWNNPEAKTDLFQDWDDEDFYLTYGNLNTKVNFEKSRLETNLFARHSVSPLYNPTPTFLGKRDPFYATKIFTFPNTLVTRDIFKLQYTHQQDNYQTELVLNKLYYEWDLAQHRLMIGRMYVNYGQGEIFNPINPFNQPTGLTSISQVAQGNDGASLTYFLSDKHNIQFLLLGDKRINDYNGTISKTIWAHGEYQATDKLQLDYVLGDDQYRHKAGGQISYQFETAMVFSQFLYQTEKYEKGPSNNFVDAMLGYDRQLTTLWHIRAEGGYQKKDRYTTLSSFGARFLPTEYFIAIANIYDVHPLVKLSGTVVNDIKSGFTYLIGRATYSMGHNIESEIFGFAPLKTGDEADNPAQKLVTTDVGLAVRAFF